VSVNILYIGEIVGKAGIYAVKKLLPELKEKYELDLVIANGEGATGGFGIGKNHSIYLRKLGVEVITAGECIYYKRDMVPHIPKAPYILRPANYPPGNPGRGWRVYQSSRNPDISIAVFVMLGQSGFNRVHLSNPYSYSLDLASKLKKETPYVVMDFHAATTAEKYTMFYHLDGKVSAVIGSHTKVQTADEQILPKGTGTICDAGRTGSNSSIGGLAVENELRKFISAVPERSSETWVDVQLQAVLLRFDEKGKTEHIETLRIDAPERPEDQEND
jgi:metallophosphoesterase (TIGR00282 family)